jgi:CHAT domain-containing protein/tetratricopeptide (TPR) repeat protein
VCVAVPLARENALGALPRAAVAAVGLAAFGAGPMSPAPAALDEHTTVLEPGEPRELELAVGASRRHLLRLSAGHVLELEVREKGPRVAVTLLDPGGGTVAARETSTETLSLFRLLAISAADGAHVLEVRSSGHGGSGTYRIHVHEPHPATDTDHARARADDAVAEAVRLSNQGTAESRREAIARLETAAALFRETNDRLGLALALHDRGFVETALGEPGASQSMEESLAVFTSLDDREGEAAALCGLGRAQLRRGNLQSAFVSFERAASLAEALGDRRTLSHYTSNAGIALARVGRFEDALDRFLRAFALGTEVGSPRGQARTLNNIGSAYKDLGDLPNALEYYHRALALWRANGMRDGELMTLTNLGGVHSLLGEHVQALVFLDEALRLTPDTASDQHGVLLDNMADVYRALGDQRRAIELAEQALALRREVRDRRGESYGLLILGRAYRDLGDADRAVKLLGDALQIQRSLGDRFLEVETRLAIAITERDRGNLSAALPHAEAAVSVIEELRAETTNPDLRASFVASEHDNYGVYLDLLVRLHERDPGAGYDGAALRASERARARVLLEALIEARADIRRGVDPDLLESERQLQKLLGDSAARLSEALRGEEGQAEVEASRRKLELMKEEYRGVQSRMRRESPRYAALTQPEPATVDELRSQLLDEDTVLLEFYLGQPRSFLWALTRSGLSTHALPPREEIEAAARRVHELLTNRRSTHSADAVRESDARLATEMGALSRVLLGDVANRLRTEWRGKRLLVVSSGALAYLPFGALPSPDESAARPLLHDHEVVVAPSASVLVAQRHEPVAKSVDWETVAVVADPVFDAGDPRVRTPAKHAETKLSTTPTGVSRAANRMGRDGFTRLPFSRREAEEITRLVPRGTLLKATDFDASRTLVTEGGLDDRRVLHFATHGLLDSEHPDLSGLVLSLVDEKGAARDGFLRMHEIYNLRLPADLVVLSACQTALGRDIRGEGLFGLTRGFMYAGARRVVASLWQVDDESTAELMKRFYRAMLKERRRPADALRTAQLELSRDRRWSAPFYWAGFVLQGEWN